MTICLSASRSRNRCTGSGVLCAAVPPQVDPLECTHCGTTMRIIALVDEAEIIERILKHLKVWDPPPEPRSTGGPDPPLPKGETLPLSYRPMPNIA